LLSLAIDSQRAGAHKRAVDAAPNRTQHAFGLDPKLGALRCLEAPSPRPAAQRAARSSLWTSSAATQNIELARNQCMRLDPSRQAVVARLSSSASRPGQSGNSRVSVRIGGRGTAALEAGGRSECDGDAEALLRAGLAPLPPLRGADAELDAVAAVPAVVVTTIAGAGVLGGGTASVERTTEGEGVLAAPRPARGSDRPTPSATNTPTATPSARSAKRFGPRGDRSRFTVAASSSRDGESIALSGNSYRGASRLRCSGLSRSRMGA